MNPILVQTISNYSRDKEINKAYLFGSFAKGLEKDTSDIDDWKLIYERKR